MTGLHQIAGLCRFGHRHLNGFGAVGGRNAGGHAFSGFNRHGESGAVDRAIAGRHGREFQKFATLAGEREANQATAKTRHEIDGFRRDMVRGQHQIAFVLAVFFIHQDDDAARFHLGDDLLHGRNGHGLQCAGHAGAFSGAVGCRLSMRST